MRNILLALLLFSGCLAYGLCQPSLVLSTCSEVISQSRAITGELEAIEGDIADMRARLDRINGRTETGRAVCSWYGRPFHGRRTASGIIYDMDSRQVAHRSLPFGTIVVFTYGGDRNCMPDRGVTYGADRVNPVNRHTGASAPASKVKYKNPYFTFRPQSKISWGVITDRGPFYDDRDYDLSRLIMSELGGIEEGVIEVEVLVIREGK